jgi:hypothetical protein
MIRYLVTILALTAYQPEPGPNSVKTSAIQNNAVTEAKLASGISVPVPSYAKASLPTPDGNVRVAKLTDHNRGLVYSNGAEWQNVGAAWPVWRIEDFGGVANDPSPGARSDNSTAWVDMMNAMGTPVGSFTQSYHVQFGEGTYYFAGPIKFLFQLDVEGASNTLLHPTTILDFPPTGDGLQIGYDNLDPTYFAAESVIKNFQVTHDQTLANWQASHTYASGAAIQPTTTKGWTGYVFVNEGSSGTSGSSEPTWLSDLQVPSGLDGSTVTDGSVTWTAKAFSLLDIRATVYAENIDARSGYGNGFFIYGNTTNSLADGGTFVNCSSEQNLSAGVFLIGQDSNENKFYNFNALFNGTWGVLDVGFLGNAWYGLDSSYNGPSFQTQYLDAWQPAMTPPVGSEIVPSVPNGYAYISAGTGSVGGSEPTWPTTLGATVTDGAITWTCRRKYAGGPIYLGNPFGGTITGLYQEGSGIKTINNGTIIGLGSVGSFDATSGGVAWNKGFHTPQGFQSSTTNATYNSNTYIGDRSSQFALFDFDLVNKAEAIQDSIGFHMLPFSTLGTNNYMGFTPNNGNFSLAIPLATNTDGGGTAPIIVPNGIRWGTAAGNGVKISESDYSILPTIHDNLGDVRLYSGAMAGDAHEAVTTIAGVGPSAIGVINDASWSAPSNGFRLDTMPDVGETDLHFILDDLATSPGSTSQPPLNLASRKGSFQIAWTGNLHVWSPLHATFTTTAYYDASMRTRKALDFRSLSSNYYGTLAANAAHVLPSSGQRSIEASFYSQSLASKFSIMGCADGSGHNGYNLSINSDGSIEFQALNTSGGNFIDLKSSTSAVAINEFHDAAVNFDSVANQYSLYLDGVMVASATSTTGTLGNSSLDVGIGSLLTSGTPTNGFGTAGGALSLIAEIERNTRTLTPSEIVAHARQFRAANNFATVQPAGVEALLSSTVIDLSLTTKQALYTVPAGQHLIVTKVIARYPSASISTADGGVGFDSGATNVSSDIGISSSMTTTSYVIGQPAGPPTIGAAAAVFGYKETATQASTTITIDTFGYLF